MAAAPLSQARGLPYVGKRALPLRELGPAARGSVAQCPLAANFNVSLCRAEPSVQSAQNDDGSLAEHLPDLALSVLFGSTSALVQGVRVKEWFMTLISPATELVLN